MLKFNNIDILLNGRGIVAENASISSNNTLQSIYTLGNNNSSLEPNAGIRNSFKIDYLLDTSYDVNFSLVAAAKIGNTIGPIPLEIAGYSDSVYLQSVAFQAQPNQPIKVAASYYSFTPISGQMTPKRGTISYDVSVENLAHGWTTFLTSSGNYLSVPTYEFSYEATLEWEPTYIIGVKEPYLVQLLGGVEKLTFTRDTFSKILFSGEEATSSLLSSDFERQIGLTGLALSWNNTANSLAFGLKNAKVTTTQLTAQVDSQIYTNVTINSSF